MTPTLAKKINDLVNELETITYHHHHYVRKTGLKRRIKNLIYREVKAIAISELPHPIKQSKKGE